MKRTVKGILLVFLLVTACQKEISDKQADYFIKFYGNYMQDQGFDVQPAGDGGYVITGSFERQGSGKDIVLIRVDKFGNQVSWSPKFFGGDGDDEGYSVRVMPDGGYIISGYVTSATGKSDKNAVLIRTDEKGDLTWQHEFGGDYDDEAKSVIAKSGGGFIFAGYTENKDSIKQIFLVNVDDQGNEISVTTRPVGGEELSSIIELSDGNFLVAGTKYVNTGATQESQILILVLNEVGNDLDNYSFGQPGVDEIVSETFPSADGSFFLVGTSSTLGGTHKEVMIKKLGRRKIYWEKTISGEGFLEGKAVCETNDGSLIAVANKTFNNTRNIDLFFLNSQGDVLSSRE
ncbi:MAG TPA: hypothetical protein VE870_03130, partial [Bacteroidales bacterium]|nr:hypothetical protein [Bacteroidales bacterium]